MRSGHPTLCSWPVRPVGLTGNGRAETQDGMITRARESGGQRGTRSPNLFSAARYRSGRLSQREGFCRHGSVRRLGSRSGWEAQVSVREKSPSKRRRLTIRAQQCSGSPAHRRQSWRARSRAGHCRSRWRRRGNHSRQQGQRSSSERACRHRR